MSEIDDLKEKVESLEEELDDKLEEIGDLEIVIRSLEGDIDKLSEELSLLEPIKEDLSELFEIYRQGKSIT